MQLHHFTLAEALRLRQGCTHPLLSPCRGRNRPRVTLWPVSEVGSELGAEPWAWPPFGGTAPHSLARLLQGLGSGLQVLEELLSASWEGTRKQGATQEHLSPHGTQCADTDPPFPRARVCWSLMLQGMPLAQS